MYSTCQAFYCVLIVNFFCITGIQRRHPGTNCYHQEEAFGNTGKFEKEQFSFSDTNKNVVLHVTATSIATTACFLCLQSGHCGQVPQYFIPPEVNPPHYFAFNKKL